MTSDGKVQLLRPRITTTDLLVGAPVRAQTWLDVASLAHWVSGRGQVVVPQHRVSMVIDNATETLRYYVPGSGRAMYRLWVLDVRSEDSTIHCEGTIAAGTATQSYRLYRSDRSFPKMLTMLEPDITPSSAEGEITIDISNDTTKGGAILRVESVGCWELPRAALDRTAADCGVSLDSLFPRRPIFDDGITPRVYSVSAVAQSIHEMTVATPLRRIGHIGRWGYPLVINSASAIPLTVGPYRIVPRKDRVAATTHTVRCRVYAANPGSVGEVRLVGGTAGAGAWASMAAGTGWSDPAEVDIDCEDQTTDDGQPAGGYDTVSVEVRTDGVSAADVYGWCVYEYE